MASETGSDLRFGIDRLVVSGTRVFGWGWVADRTRAIREVKLGLHGRGWEKTLPATFGLPREDVVQAFPGFVAARFSGFVVTGYVDDASLENVSIDVIFDDGERARFDLGSVAEVKEAARAHRYTPARILRAAWRRLKARDFAGFLPSASSDATIASADDASGRDALLAALRDAARVRIVFDHSMGGGANQYRRALIADWLAAGDTAILCTYHLPALEYRFHVMRSGTPEREFRASSFIALEPVLAQAPVAELFVNSPVSFDQPIVFADWLARMRKRHDSLRLTVTAHDYFAVCPSFVLLDADGRFCGIPEMRECDRCLARHRSAHVAFSPPTAIAPWREAWNRCLEAADEVRCFSESTRALLARAYDSAAARATVVPHRVDFSPRRPNLTHSQPLVIGIVGQINEQKGAHIVADLVRRIEKTHANARVVMIGSLEIPFRSPRLEVTGAYRREDLPALIEKHAINIAFFPSIWPETFSYVVAEMMALALPIVAFDLGAPAERLRGYPLARLSPRIDAEAALETLLAFHAELAASEARAA